ncbi:MAG TPA: zf-HC2 domain-containing protein [Pyrinomonadaceae bacterium]|jgi:hypothetical protein
MNEPTRDTSNNEQARGELERQGCTRGVELVAYLYGEASEPEAESFGRHLSACAHCRDELSAFGDVRAAVGEWRTEALSGAYAFAPVAASAGASEKAQPARASRRRSALAALRAFFELSPLWLRAGSVAAVLAVCALAALTFARAEVRWDDEGLALQTGGGVRVVEKRVEVPVRVAPSERELETMVEERVRLQLESIGNRPEEARSIDASASSARPSHASRRPRTIQAEAALRETPQSASARRATAQRRQQLAARRLDDRNEENLPRLYDLLDEVHED